MDMSFWALRVHSASTAKKLSSVQSDNCLIIDDMERDEDVRAWFPCPFCYVEIEVPVLCNHLQEEHCFDLKNAVCPICAANLGKDAIGHFTSQHAHSVKRKRKSQKSGSWSNSPSIPRELGLFTSPISLSGSRNLLEDAPDPLLSPFLCNVPLSDPKVDQEDRLSGDAITTTQEAKSTKSSKLDVIREQDYEERMLRVEFIQQLVASTIF